MARDPVVDGARHDLEVFGQLDIGGAKQAIVVGELAERSLPTAPGASNASTVASANKNAPPAESFGRLRTSREEQEGGW